MRANEVPRGDVRGLPSSDILHRAVGSFISLLN